MKPSLQKLQKFFKLEADRGYDNHAVMGGLNRMLDLWVPEARQDSVPEDLIQFIIARLQDYPRLTEKSRAETLKGIWRRVQRSETGLPMDALDEPALPIPETPAAPAASQPVEQPARPQAAPRRAEPPQPPAARPETRPAEPAPRPRSRPAGGLSVAGAPAALNAPVTVLQGIGPRNAQTLAHLGIYTLRDMLYYFPRRYDDYSCLKPINRLWYGEEVTVIGTVQTVTHRPIRGGKATMIEAIVSDGTGSLRISWFNQPWVARQLQHDTQVAISGKVEQYLGRLTMTNPEMEQLDQQQLHTNRIVPVYPLKANITQRWLRKHMNAVVSYWALRVQEALPETVLQSADLADISTALLQVHYPDSWESLKDAQQRLAFDEIFLLQLGVLDQKRTWQERTARAFPIEPDFLNQQITRLPFQLTGAQQRAVQDVRIDLGAGRPMNRLIQGDVGSGKTAVAALAVAMIASQGAQASLMAPTSILAEQHYKNLLGMLAGERPAASAKPDPTVAPSLDAAPEEVEASELADPAADEEEIILPATTEPEAASAPAAETEPEVPASPPLLAAGEIALLVGATPEAEKRRVRDGLADGSIRLVIGTHALIEDPVTFADLQLVIVDEQHRFGVGQRAALRAKGDNPHLLVMTATPIPRSLALTVYGDLDLTVLDEMPPGRQPVDTFVLMPRERERAYTLIRGEIEQGRQAFVIYPLVAENQDNPESEARAAIEEHARLQKEVFPKLRLGLLHGRMSPEEKDSVMATFRSGETSVLVSTTVVEVGVDIPNASVMLIESANRFGLAQLHQLRGRVGRGGHKSYCLLIPDNPAEAENERLQAMAETNDGFVLAERDLEQRGPGQFLGTRQSGYAELQFANLTDVRLIEKARRQAQALFSQDPNLSLPEHQLLASALQRFWGGGKGDIS